MVINPAKFSQAPFSLFFLSLLLIVSSCVCPEEDVGFQQYTPNYEHYSPTSKEFFDSERFLAEQIFSLPRHPLTQSEYLQRLCFRLIKDPCVVVNYSRDVLLYFPGKGMIITPSVIQASEFESELVAALLWEYNRRALRLPMIFDHYTANQNLCIEPRPDPSPENLSDLTKLTFSSLAEYNPRALPLILDELKKRVDCKSIGYFAFKKNYYFNQVIGELRRQYADRKENITTPAYKAFYEKYFRSST